MGVAVALVINVAHRARENACGVRGIIREARGEMEVL